MKIHNHILTSAWRGWEEELQENIQSNWKTERQAFLTFQEAALKIKSVKEIINSWNRIDKS